MVNCIQFSVYENVAVTENEAGRWIESPDDLGSSARYSFDSLVMLPGVPGSFWQGLRECEEGYHVDMDRALGEPPPEQ